MLILPIYPIITVGSPTAAVAPQTETSPTRIAGFPPINTVVLPIGNGPTVGTCAGGGIAQMWLSPITEAGMPPIKTVGSPGPAIIPP